MPELKSAATKNFQLYWNETDRTVTITFNGGYTSTVPRTEGATLAVLLKNMCEYDD